MECCLIFCCVPSLEPTKRVGMRFPVLCQYNVQYFISNNVIMKIYVNEYDKKLNLTDNPLFGKLKNLANF